MLDRRFDNVEYVDWLKDSGTGEPLRIGAGGIKAMYADAPEGVAPRTMKAGWDLLQKVHQAEPKSAHEALATLKAGGATGCWLKVHAGTTKDEGTRIWAMRDFETVFEGLDLSSFTTQLHPGANGFYAATAFAAYLETSEHEISTLKGGFGLDPLSTLAGQGTLSGGTSLARRHLCSVARWCVKKAPGLRAVLVSSQPYHDAGASPEQEVSWSLATAATYLAWLHDDGMSWEDAANQVVFEMPVDNQFFVNMAKLRAIRVLWERLLLCLGVEVKVNLHASTSTRLMSSVDVSTNILRSSGSVFASVLGGATSVSCMPFDLPTGKSSPLAQRVALNTQHIFKEEGFMGAVADPGAGSYLVEHLTDRIVRYAWSQQEAIRASGGMVSELCSGRIHQALEERRDHLEGATATRALTHVGVNRFVDPTSERYDDATVSSGNPWSPVQEEDLERHDALLDLSVELEDIENAEGFFQSMVRALGRGADVFSCRDLASAGHSDLFLSPLPPSHLATAWESLRRRADRFLKLSKDPERFAAWLLHAPGLTARAEFAESVLKAAGVGSRILEVTDMDELPDDPLPWVVVLIPSETNEELSATIQSLKESGVRLVYTVGKSAEELSVAGVDGFLFEGSDLLTTMESLYRRLGVGS